jgi:hypothetical protein
MNNKVLAICVVTDKTDHPYWFQGAEPNIDLFVVYCGTRTDDIFRMKSTYYLRSEGLFKLENVELAIKFLGQKIYDYAAVWLPDDDIRASGADINHFIKLFLENNFDAAHPALKTDRGQINHQLLMQQPELLYREVYFVEMMAPIFRIEIFIEFILPTLLLNRSGFGIDLLWAQVLEGKRVAIIDASPMWHKFALAAQHFPALGAYYAHLKKVGVDPHEDLSKIISHYKIDVKKYLNSVNRTVLLTLG